MTTQEKSEKKPLGLPRGGAQPPQGGRRLEHPASPLHRVPEPVIEEVWFEGITGSRSRRCHLARIARIREEPPE